MGSWQIGLVRSSDTIEVVCVGDSNTSDSGDIFRMLLRQASCAYVCLVRVMHVAWYHVMLAPVPQHRAVRACAPPDVDAPHVLAPLTFRVLVQAPSFLHVLARTLLLFRAEYLSGAWAWLLSYDLRLCVIREFL